MKDQKYEQTKQLCRKVLTWKVGETQIVSHPDLHAHVMAIRCSARMSPVVQRKLHRLMMWIAKNDI